MKTCGTKTKKFSRHVFRSIEMENSRA
ncbi:DUF1661 domain-containing protein [Porphyromonas gingivalis]